MSLFDNDYTFCGNPNKCPKKHKCKRADFVPGVHSYSMFYDPNSADCEYFWNKNKKESDINAK